MQSNTRLPRKYVTRSPSPNQKQSFQSPRAINRAGRHLESERLASEVSQMVIPQRSDLQNSISFLDSQIHRSQREIPELQLKPLRNTRNFFSCKPDSGQRCLLNNMKFMLNQKRNKAQKEIKKRPSKLSRWKRIVSSDSPTSPQKIKMNPIGFESDIIFPHLGDMAFASETINEELEHPNLILKLKNRKPIVGKSKGVFCDDYQLDEAKKERDRADRTELLVESQEVQNLFKKAGSKPFVYQSPPKQPKKNFVFPPKLDRKLEERKRKFNAARSLNFMDVHENLWTHELNSKWDDITLHSKKEKKAGKVSNKNFCDFFGHSDEESASENEMCLLEPKISDSYNNFESTSNKLFESPNKNRVKKNVELFSTKIEKNFKPSFAVRTPKHLPFFENRKNSCTSLEQTPQGVGLSLNRFLTSDRARTRTQKLKDSGTSGLSGRMNPNLKKPEYNAVMNPNIVTYETAFPAFIPALGSDESLEQIEEEAMSTSSAEKELEALLGDPAARPMSLRINTATDLFVETKSPRFGVKDEYALDVSVEKAVVRPKNSFRSPIHFEF